MVREPNFVRPFAYTWRERSRIQAFLKCISDMQNANSLVNDLKLGGFVHYLRQ